jgi:two-component system invasion response regulator UvrY
MKIRVIIADDHSVVVAGMNAVLKSDHRLEVCGIFQDGNSVLEFLQNNEVDLAILDLDMPGAQNFSLLKHLKEKFPKLKIIIFTMNNGIQSFFQAGKLGADSYVLKSESITYLPIIIMQTMNGVFYCSDELKVYLTQKKSELKLKPLEFEILGSLALGLVYSEIAEKIGKSEKTVEYYIYKLRKKYNANNNTELLHKLKDEISIPVR